MRIVLDSNVLMSAFGTRGLCDALFEACAKRHEIFASQGILDEVATHLGNKFKMPADRVEQIIRYLKDECTIVVPGEVAANACRDPDDLVILGTSIAARAEVIVTGDRDLLDLKQYGAIAICSPREMYERLRAKGK